MFYIYDPDGVRFRGPLEVLEQQRRVKPREPVPPLEQGRRSTPYPERTGAREAAQAYRQAAARENMVEPLVYIYQIMSAPAITIDHEARLSEAWRQLQEHNIRQLVVVSEKNALMGMLSDRDILQRLNVIGDEVEIARDLGIAQLVQRETITTDAMSDIRRVARVMALYHVDALPVIGTGSRLAGIVTRGDILRGFAENPRLNLWG